MLDTLILVGAFCVLTNEADTGFIAFSADSLIIQTKLIQERSKAKWVARNNVESQKGTLVTIKYANQVQIYNSKNLILSEYKNK